MDWCTIGNLASQVFNFIQSVGHAHHLYETLGVSELLEEVSDFFNEAPGPNLVKGDNGWLPAPGYRWKDQGNSNDFTVIPK